MNRFYRRHLPHWVPDDVPVFVTWNLKGALPKTAFERLRQAREAWEREADQRGEADEEDSKRLAGQLFRITEEYLDAARDGPRWLQDERCAETVARTILEGTEKWYDLFAYVVMANHVHALLTPLVDLERITCGIKMKTAREINKLMGRTGKVFWQDESFDHWVRSPEQFAKTIRYIKHNPVKAGLCATPQNWPWSSSAMRKNWPWGKAYGRSGL